MRAQTCERGYAPVVPNSSAEVSVFRLLLHLPHRVNGKDLREMMLEVVDVLVHKILERRGLARGNHPKRGFVEVVARTAKGANLHRNRRHHARQMQIEQRPERQEL